jgi:DHA1 family multidrug resistance protein-like MFS transporter
MGTDKHDSSDTIGGEADLRNGAAPRFQHTMSKSVTGPEFLVDFEGPDDAYRPRNWPMQKQKLITTALYGLTTMSATWTTSK